MTTREHVARMRGKAIVISAGDKGGIGKSFTTRCMAHNLLKWGFKWVGFDGDGRNSHLQRFYGRHASVDIHVLKTEDDFDRLLDKIEGVDPASHILVDTPAGAGDLMEKRGRRLLDLSAHLQRPLFRLWALDEEDDVLLAIRREQEALGLANILAVMNGRFGGRDAFELWDSPLGDGAPSFRDQVLVAGGSEIYLRAMPIRPRTAVRNMRCAFHEAEAKLSSLTFSQSLNLSEWLADMEQAFLPFKAKIEGK